MYALIEISHRMLENSAFDHAEEWVTSPFYRDAAGSAMDCRPDRSDRADNRQPQPTSFTARPLSVNAELQTIGILST
jgi:hypothetical protein